MDNKTPEERKQSIMEIAKQRAQKQGSVVDAKSFYSNIPEDTLYSMMNTQMTAPKGPADLANNPDEPWGKPDGWDYQTAEFGWKGEELPNGAVGWKPDGTAWYGGDNAWDEWKKSWQNKINAPSEQSGESYWESFKKKMTTPVGGPGASFANVFSAFGDMFNALGNYNMKGGETPTGMAKASRTIGQLFQGVATGLGRVSEIAEKEVFSRIQAWEDIAAAGNVGFDIASDEKAREAAQNFRENSWLAQTKTSWIDGSVLAGHLSDAFLFLTNIADVVSPIHAVWNGIRAAASPITAEEKKDIMKERVRSGEVLYSTFIEPAIKESYLSKVKEGRHPYLVALEVQKPFAEMAGQMILDPMNLIGLLSKGEKAVGAIDSFVDYMGKPLEKYGEFFKVGESGIAALDKESDLARMAEMVIEGRQDAAKLLESMSIELNVKGPGPLGFLKPKINAALEKSGIFGWSASGKRHHLQRVASDMMHTILQTVGKDPDEALSIVKYMVQMQSDNVDEVAEAIAYLGGSKMPMNMVMSEGGQRFGAVFREVLADSDGLIDGEKFLKQVEKLKDPIQLQEFFDKKIDKVANRMFPSLSKRAEIIGKFEAGEELSKAEKLIGTTPLTAGEQFFLKAENLADAKSLQTINGFFANVYMGLSPGYAFRNLWTNEFHLFIDMGPAEYVKSWAHFNPRVAEKQLDYLTRSSIGQLASVGIGQTGNIGSGKKVFFGKRLAGMFEKMGGQRAYGMAYKDTIEKIVPKIFDEITPRLRSAGATEDQIRIYQDVVKATYGRFDEAGEALSNAMKAGQISLFETMGWMPDEMSKFFKDYRLDDEIRNIIRNSGGLSVNEVQQKVSTLYDEVRQYIKTTENQISFASIDEVRGLDGFEHVDDMMRRLDDLPMMSDDVKAATKHHSIQNRIADERYQMALTDSVNLFNEQMKASGITANDVLDKIEDVRLKNLMQDVLHGKYYKQPYEHYRQTIYTPIETWIRRLSPGSDYMKNRKWEDALSQAWKEIPSLRESLPPKNLSYQQFRDLMYDIVLPSETLKHFSPLRDAHAEIATIWLKELKANGLQMDEALTGMWRGAEKQLDRARAFDTHIVRNVSFDDLGHATGDVVNNISLATDQFNDYMAVKKLAAVNGMSTGYFDAAQSRVIPTNHLLKKINSTLEEMGMGTYKHLDQVPFDIAESAIQRIKGKDFQPVFRGPQATRVEIPPVFQTIIESAKTTSPTTLIRNMDERLQAYVKAISLDMAYSLDVIQGKGYNWKFYPRWWNDPTVGFTKLSYKGKTGGKAVVNALYDMYEGKDTDAKIFQELRNFILNRQVGAVKEFHQSEAQALMYEFKRLRQVYSKEPSALDDVLADLVENIPPTGAGATTALFSPEDIARFTEPSGNVPSILDRAKNSLSNWPLTKPGEPVPDLFIEDVKRSLKNLEVDFQYDPSTDPNKLRQLLSQKVNEIDQVLIGKVTEKNIGVGANADDINYAFSQVFDSLNLNLDDDFWNGSIKVPGPEFMSDPHAYLAAAPQIRMQFQNLMTMIADNHGKVADVFDNPQLFEALKDINARAGQLETNMRLAANEYGTAFRNFALVNYDSRRNIDTLTGLGMPYQFWYSRTFPNWGRRVAHNPTILANYGRYKEMLAQVHAGLPEYWQQNINTKELLGLFPDNPLFFNLEQTLNPLQGLTGVDFEDPYKRIDAWSRMLDDLNRFGPTTNPIYSYATAFAYLLRGEKDAASRWGGRLIPQTNTLKALGSVLGMPGLTKEIDPMVWLFSGGVDPYERNRTGRAFPAMINEMQLSPEQAIDAAWTQQGPYWEEARQRAVGERAWGQLASFFLGVGFKGRNKDDIRTDMMYDEFFSLMNQRARMTNDQFKQEMNRISQKYPFMDSVLLSKKTGWARDLAFAYTILDRIPPGDSSRIYEMAGIDQRLVDRFYESKGDFTTWPESDRQRFMSGIIDINATLAIPDDFTAQQWTNAKAEYSKMTDEMKRIYGEEIDGMIDNYYALRNAGKTTEADLFLQRNPKIEMAMAWKDGQIIDNPYMEAYYSGLKKIGGYYFGQMYDEAEKKWPGIFNIQSDYMNLSTKAEKNAYKRQYPQLQQYWDWKEKEELRVNQIVIDLASKLPQALEAQFRPDLPADMATGVQDIQSGLSQPEDVYLTVSPEEWRNIVGESAFTAVYQYLEGGKMIDYKTDQALKEIADQMGVNTNRLIQYIGLSLQQ